MTTLLHELENLDELLEVLALCRPKPVRLKERNDDLIEIAESPNDIAGTAALGDCLSVC
jgi:hypothetical protein